MKKYSPSGKEITGNIVVNSVSGIAGDGRSSVALFNDGSFLVVWIVESSGSGVELGDMFGQLFRDDSVKVGGNFQINQIPSGAARPPSVLANEHDQIFWIFYCLSTSKGYKIHVQKMDKSGNKIGGPFLLNPQSATQNEFECSVVLDGQGFTAAWAGAEGNVGTFLNIFLRRYYADGTPRDFAIIVNDDIGNHAQFQPDVCVDKSGNTFLAWGDERNSQPQFFSSRYDIYGQLFGADGARIGVNVRLENLSFAENTEPDVEFTGNEFQVSWLSWDDVNRRYLTYVNRWKYNPILYGEMISSVFDASPSGATFTSLSWNGAFVPQPQVRFKLRTAKRLDQLQSAQWYGPHDVSDFYVNNTGEAINAIHNGGRYIQYKAIFSSVDGSSSVLDSVAIAYLPTDSIAPSAPTGLRTTGAHAKVILQWNPNSEADLLEYLVRRGTAPNNPDPVWKMVVAGSTTTVEDTSARTGTLYYYAVAAIDSSHNQGSCSSEASGVAFGINLYVSARASSSGDGSIGNPFNTLQQGINAALYGDTVRIMPGAYGDAFTTKNGVSLIGAGPEQCQINFTLNASDNCVIRGLTLTKSLVCSSVSPVITGNIFRGASDFWASAIELKFGASPTISKNFITECTMGIRMLSRCMPLIRNNVMNVSDGGLFISWDDRPTIRNNTVIAKSYFALQLQSFDSVKVENNIFVVLDQNAVAYPVMPGFATPIIVYNDFWNANHPDTQVPTTNLFLDPKFVSMDLQDYHLLPSSPCVDAGNPDTTHNDLDGSRNNMGAYGGPDPMETQSSWQLTKSIYASTLSAYPGDTVSVMVGLDNCAGLAKADFSMGYDPSLLTFVQARLTQATQGFKLQTRATLSGRIDISLSSNAASSSGRNNLVELRFVVRSSAKANDASPLTLNNVSLVNEDAREMFVRSVTDGVLVVTLSNESVHCIFVDGKNSGLEEGSRPHPYSTITKALEHANAGDTILVVGGEYRESFAMKEGVSLIGSGASVTKLIIGGMQDAIKFNHINQAEISGFTIWGDETHFVGPLIDCDSSAPLIKKNRFDAAMAKDYGIACRNGSNATIENNYLREFALMIDMSNPLIRNNVVEALTWGGISCSNGSAPLIVGNRIEGHFGASAVMVQRSSPTFKNNRIFCDDGGWGFFISSATDMKIFNNIVQDKSKSGEGFRILNSLNTEIINNTIVTRGKGIEEQGCQSKILNNIITGNGDFGLLVSPATTYDYNDVWNNVVNYSEANAGTHDLSNDPLFVGAAKGDYRISATSPCVDRGHPDQAYNDLDGSRNDIGASGGPYADPSWYQSIDGSMVIDSISSVLSDTVEVMIKAKSLNGSVVVDLTLSYDPMALKLVNASVGDMTRSFSLEKKNLNAGSMNLCLKSMKGLGGEEGELIRLYLAAANQQAVNASLQIDSAKVTDEATYTRSIYDLKGGHIILTDIGKAANNPVPRTFELYQNYPNPFNPTATITFDLPQASHVAIAVYDILGRNIKTLMDEVKQPGSHKVLFDGAALPSGVYFYRIQAGRYSAVKKMMLVK